MEEFLDIADFEFHRLKDLADKALAQMATWPFTTLGEGNRTASRSW